MEGVSLYHLKNYNIVIEVNLPSSFYSYLSEDKNNDTRDTHAEMTNIYQNRMDEYIIKPNKSTIWGEIDDCVNQYMCILAVYLVTIV